MYDRYSDISKFITDPEKLTLKNNECYISGENDYDIAVDLEICYGSFEEVKPYIPLITEHINELDNTVQRFDNKWNGFSGLQETMYFLNWIGIPKPNFVTLEYICTDVNSEFNVLFEYKSKRFYIREFGLVKNIPDDWETRKNEGLAWKN